MKILIAAHKHPLLWEPRGGEHSMRIIADHLSSQGHRVTVVVRDDRISTRAVGDVKYYSGKWRELPNFVRDCDTVLSWGKAAPEAYLHARRLNRRMILFVRWWRNIQPLPPKDLMTRDLDMEFIRSNQNMFNYCSVVTNNNYSAEVIKRCYGVTATVSYVPVLGGKKPNPGGKYVTLITPDKGLGEPWLITQLSKLGVNLLVVNPEMNLDLYKQLKVEVMPYTSNMLEVWNRTKVLLMPVYGNDICGTTRVVIEAMRHGIPVVANDRCGVGEKVPNLVSREAKGEEWREIIKCVCRDYELHITAAHEVWDDYDTGGQLEKIETLL